MSESEPVDEYLQPTRAPCLARYRPPMRPAIQLSEDQRRRIERMRDLAWLAEEVERIRVERWARVLGRPRR